MNEKSCEDCKYFNQFYYKVISGYQIHYERANAGVCELLSKIECRRQTDKICNEYKEKYIFRDE